jgi:hypothetical protein
MATLAPTASREEAFYQRMALGLALFILFGFLQFAARGMVDYARVPLMIHVHALAMVAWLALLVTQATLVARDNLALHRRLGWYGAALATLIPFVAVGACLAVFNVGMNPPFFTPAFFLSLVTIESVLFAALVWFAISRRRQTDWHRRLMIGATVILMEPALERLLPMPIIGGENGDWIAMIIQLGALGLVVRHDRASIGRIHPASVTAMATVVLGHALVSVAARLPMVIDLTGALTS